MSRREKHPEALVGCELRPIHREEGVMALLRQMFSHLPPFRSSLVTSPPPALVEDPARRTLLKCSAHVLHALGRVEGSGAAFVFAGVDVAEPRRLAWWTLSVDPSEPLPRPFVSRLRPRSTRHRRPGTELTEIHRQVRDDDGWRSLQDFPRLIEREEMH